MRAKDVGTGRLSRFTLLCAASTGGLACLFGILGLMGVIDGRRGWLAFEMCALSCGTSILMFVRSGHVRELEAPRHPGALERPVQGTMHPGRKTMQVLFGPRDRARLEVLENSLLVIRIGDIGRGILVMWIAAVIAREVLLPEVDGLRFSGPALLGVSEGMLAAYLVFAWPERRRRKEIPWTDVRVAVESEQGVEFYFAERDGPPELAFEADTRARRRLVALLDGKCPVVPLAPAARPVHDRAPSTAIDAKKLRELDAALDRLRRL